MVISLQNKLIQRWHQKYSPARHQALRNHGVQSMRKEAKFQKISNRMWMRIKWRLMNISNQQAIKKHICFPYQGTNQKRTSDTPAKTCLKVNLKMVMQMTSTNQSLICVSRNRWGGWKCSPRVRGRMFQLNVTQMGQNKKKDGTQVWAREFGFDWHAYWKTQTNEVKIGGGHRCSKREKA